MYLSCWSACLATRKPVFGFQYTTGSTGACCNPSSWEELGGGGKRDEIYKVTYFWDKDKEAGWRWQVFRRGRKRGRGEQLKQQFKEQVLPGL